MAGWGRNLTIAITAMLLAAGTVSAKADVVTRFVAPEQYTDAQNRFGSGLSLRVTLEEVRRIIEGEGRRALRPGEALTIDVLDIDLAGFEQPGASGPYGIRVVRDISPPRLRLRYVLSQRGRTILTGEETLTDANFLMSSSQHQGGSFSYERELIRTWMRERVADRRPVGS